VTCDRCPISLLCLSGSIPPSVIYRCGTCCGVNLDLGTSRRSYFRCDQPQLREAYKRTLQRRQSCLHCCMSQVVFYDHEHGQQVLYERRKPGARLKLHAFTTGARLPRTPPRSEPR